MERVCREISKSIYLDYSFGHKNSKILIDRNGSFLEIEDIKQNMGD
jgi:hypothetical protein